jgi:hypothetical protein
MNYYFEEEQQFNQWWLWISLLVGGLTPIGLLAYGLGQQLISGQPWGDNPMSNLGLALMLLLAVVLLGGLCWLFFVARLETKIDRWSVQYKFKPFINSWQRLEKESIQSYRVRKYFAGGYGVRWSLDGIKTLNVRGIKALELTFTNGKKLLIGTQQPDQILKAMDAMKNPQ